MSARRVTAVSHGSSPLVPDDGVQRSRQSSSETNVYVSEDGAHIARSHVRTEETVESVRTPACWIHLSSCTGSSAEDMPFSPVQVTKTVVQQQSTAVTNQLEALEKSRTVSKLAMSEMVAEVCNGNAECCHAEPLCEFIGSLARYRCSDHAPSKTDRRLER